MSHNMLGSSEWLRYCQETITRPATLPGGLSHDATVVTTSASTDNTLSLGNSSAAGGQLNPKGCISKPIRRRSRVSKRTPITLLSANTTNFRALVQQFTGCPRDTLSFGAQRGPLSFNFALARHHNDLDASNSIGYSYNYPQVQTQLQQQQEQQLQHHHHQQEYHQEQQCMFSFEKNPSDVYPSTCNNPTPNIQTLDDFLPENLIRWKYE